MTDVDRLDLPARIGICFKIGAEGSFGVDTQGEDVFCVLPTGFDKSLIYRMFVHANLQVPYNGRPSLLSRLAKKAGSVGNTRLLPHANSPLVPMNCFLCRVDCALEENVLTEQM